MNRDAKRRRSFKPPQPPHPSRPQTLFKSSNTLGIDLGGQNRSKAQSIKQTQAVLDPFAQSAVVKKLTR